MPRIGRAIVEGIPYHITQRDNRREDIFFEDDDRTRYHSWLHDYSSKQGLKVWAYCLMTNHVYFIVFPERADSIERVMRPLHMRYAQYINKKKGWVGHLWQGRYFSIALDEQYLWSAVRYVERNPLRAGIVKVSENYHWSSAAAHCGKRDDHLLSSDLPLIGDIKDWSEWLKEPEKESEMEILRQNTQKGLPCGNDSFIAKLEGLLNRELKFRPPGRPRKTREADNV